MALPPPPLLTLDGEFPLFEDSSLFFEPVTISLPLHAVPLEAPVDVVERLKDDIWYINIVSDGVFEYRSVEVPFELVSYCPNRNLTERECRSIGITQSKGWENYWRQPSEKNILLFRRPICDEAAVVTGVIQSQIDKGIEMVSKFVPSVIDGCMLNFPMSVFDQPRTDLQELYRGRTQIVFPSVPEVAAFQLEILKFALKSL